MDLLSPSMRQANQVGIVAPAEKIFPDPFFSQAGAKRRREGRRRTNLLVVVVVLGGGGRTDRGNGTRSYEEGRKKEVPLPTAAQSETVDLSEQLFVRCGRIRVGCWMLEGMGQNRIHEPSKVCLPCYVVRKGTRGKSRRELSPLGSPAARVILVGCLFQEMAFTVLRS